jgi:hypothetical protein
MGHVRLATALPARTVFLALEALIWSTKVQLVYRHVTMVNLPQTIISVPFAVPIVRHALPALPIAKPVVLLQPESPFTSTVLPVLQFARILTMLTQAHTNVNPVIVLAIPAQDHYQRIVWLVPVAVCVPVIILVNPHALMANTLKATFAILAKVNAQSVVALLHAQRAKLWLDSHIISILQAVLLFAQQQPTLISVVWPVLLVLCLVLLAVGELASAQVVIPHRQLHT